MFKINITQFSHALVLWVLVVLVLGACSSLRKEPQDGPPTVVERSQASTPEGDVTSQIPNQIPRVEPLSKYGNPKSYVVFGKTYYTLPSSQGFVERGIASWYGKKFHGRLTSSREPYDMYGMTAAHTQLPLPSYVQVTNLKNGKQVVLRVNDRGPFHGNRVIDLSYTAAMKLDIVKEGTGLVEVRALDPRNYKLENQLILKEPANDNSELNIETTAVITKAEVAPENSAIILKDIPEKLSEQQSVDEVNSTVTVTETIASTTANATLSSDPQVYIQVGAFGDRSNADQLKNQLSGLNLGVVSILSVVKNAISLHRVRIGPLASVQAADDAVIELNAMGMSGHRVIIE